MRLAVGLRCVFCAISCVLLVSLGISLVTAMKAPALLSVVVLATGSVIVEWRGLAAELNDQRAGVLAVAREADARIEAGDPAGAI